MYTSLGKVDDNTNYSSPACPGICDGSGCADSNPNDTCIVRSDGDIYPDKWYFIVFAIGNDGNGNTFIYHKQISDSDTTFG